MIPGASAARSTDQIADPSRSAVTTPGGKTGLGWIPAVSAMLIVLLACFVYSPVLRGGWLWDDPVDITTNPNLRDGAGLARIWAEPGSAANYFPLKSTVQWVQWHLWGDWTPGYHLTNVLLHATSAILFAVVLRRLGAPAAGWGGLIFAVHPLTVESVAWISELKNTLSLALLLASILAYLSFDDAREFRDAAAAYAAALGLFILAMLGKSTVAMFPAAILLYVWWKRGRVAKRDWISVAPFFAVSLLLGLVAIYCEHQWPLKLAAPDLPTRFGLAGAMLVFYLRMSVAPFGLVPIYPRWDFTEPWLVFASAWILLVLIGAGCWRKRRGWGRHALLALGWWAVNLLPVLGFVPMSYHQFSWVADHFAYVSLLGIVGGGAALCGTVWKRLDFGWKRPALALGGALLVIGLALDSRNYARVFRSGEVLWTFTLERNPNAGIAENGLGYDLLLSGRVAQATEHLERAVSLQPQSELAQYNLGDAFLQAGRLRDAAESYEKAIALNPNYANAHNDLGMVLCRLGRAGDAVPHFQAVLRLQPTLAGAHSNLGNAYLMLGKVAEAVAEYEEALRMDPSQTGTRTYLNLARQMESRGEAP
jgi:tetratricopeptide (TPR) repeat protein